MQQQRIKYEYKKNPNDSEVQRNLSNGGNRVKTRNEFSPGRYTPPMVYEASPQIDLLEHSVRLKRNTRHILPISTQELHVGRKNRQFLTSQKKIFLNEDDTVTHDHDFQKMDPSTRRITLARKPPIGLNSQTERDQVECEIRTLTDY